jgi:hypothetical protein
MNKRLRLCLIFISLFILVLFILPPSLKAVVSTVSVNHELYPISVGSFLHSIKAKADAARVLNAVEVTDYETYYYVTFSSGGWLGSTKITKITQVVFGKIDSITTISKDHSDSSLEPELTITTQTAEELSEGVVNSPHSKSRKIEWCREYMSKNILWNELYFEVPEGGEKIYCGYKEYGLADLIADAGSTRRGGGVSIDDNYYPGYFDLEEYRAQEGF